MLRYQQIADDLRRSIVTNELAVGERLAPLRELARRYDVTIPTVRQAIAMLTAEDLLRSEHGSGTYVTDTGARHEGLTSFAGGPSTSTEVLGREIRWHDEPAAAALGLAAGAGLTRLRRARLVEGRAAVVQDSFMAARYAGALAGYRADQALYPYLRSRLGLVGVHATQQVQAGVADDEEAALLQVPAGHPVLRSSKTSLSHDGTPFLFDRAVIDSARVVLTVTHHGVTADVEYRPEAGPTD